MTPKSETQIRHDFQLAICRKEFGECQYWNNGCTLNQTACRKLSDYRVKVRKEEKKLLEWETQKEIESKRTEKHIPKNVVIAKLQSTLKLIESMQYDINKISRVNNILIFEMGQAMKDVKELISF